MHCCLQEKEVYNPFYALLAQRLIKENATSFKYSFKYTLWDYLKTITTLQIKQIYNLAKMTAYLLSEMSIPLHFLKVIDFEQEEPKAHAFLHLVFENLIVLVPVDNKQKLHSIIDLGLNEKDLGSFGKDLCQFLLTTFYLRYKQSFKGQIPEDNKVKLKVIFDTIKAKKEAIYIETQIKK